MNKGNVILKKSLSMNDKAAMIHFLVDRYFISDDNDRIYYVPYFRDTNFMEAFFKYMVDGLEFENDENVFISVKEDNSLIKIFDDWMQNTYPKKLTTLAKQISGIMNDVEDMVAFRKDTLIASHSNPSISPMIEMKLLELIEKESSRNDVETAALKQIEKFYENQNKLNELMPPEEQAELTRQMAEKEFDPAKISELLADKYFGSDEHAAKLSELFDTKQEIIEVLKNEIIEKDKLILNMNKQFGNPLNLDVTLVD